SVTGVTQRAPLTDPGNIAAVNSFLTTITTPLEMDKQAELMEDAFITRAREEFDWKRVEPRKGYFEWQKFDLAVNVAYARNIDFIGKLVYTAPWASSAPPGTAPQDVEYYPPSNMDDYVRYVEAVVTRYKDRVKVWEVWNEPNIPTFWKPSPDPQRYAEMLSKTYAAIKKIDPDAVVLSAGVAGFDNNYMEAMAAAGAGASYDGLGLHTFGATNPEADESHVWLSNARSYLARHNPNAKIWITEMAWSTCQLGGEACSNPVSEATQASYLSRAYIDAAQQGVASIAWWSLTEFGDSSSRLDNYGLVDRTGRKKPAYTSLQDVGRALYRSVSLGEVMPSSGPATVIDALASTSGWSAWGLSGSNATKSSTGISGGTRVSYDIGVGAGFALSANRVIPGEPGAISLLVRGDGSSNPVYLKFTDAKGEQFQGLIGHLESPSYWNRMVFHLDGTGVDRTSAGGDRIVDYPITVNNVFVYSGRTPVKQGVVDFQNLTAHYGVALRGASFIGQGFNTQAVYSLRPPSGSVTVPVSSTTAYSRSGGGFVSLAVANGSASAQLGTAPKFIVSVLGIQVGTDNVRIRWIGGDLVSSESVRILTGSMSAVAQPTIASRAADGSVLSTWNGRIGTSRAPGMSYRAQMTVSGTNGRSATIETIFSWPG
ncbi:endo-1,4-beta-xylanase, partial [Rathayibacter sp. VKM Ac-2630]|uniref:endo-1,4-beta-xylanase n=1 Tax=Rathayibacter sp. VKM Ac-2630 TaxID=1938617 RepID=UPI0009CD5437